MTLFAFETKLAQNRLGGTFTLILTSFSFKNTSNKSIPAISYLTSLDKYQIYSIIFLCLCCVWHATCASLHIDLEKKVFLDRIALCFFTTMYIVMQAVLIIIFWFSYKKIKILRISERTFETNSSINFDDGDDDDDDED